MSISEIVNHLENMSTSLSNCIFCKALVFDSKSLELLVENNYEFINDYDCPSNDSKHIFMAMFRRRENIAKKLVAKHTHGTVDYNDICKACFSQECTSLENFIFEMNSKFGDIFKKQDCNYHITNNYQ